MSEADIFAKRKYRAQSKDPSDHRAADAPERRSHHGGVLPSLSRTLTGVQPKG